MRTLAQPLCLLACLLGACGASETADNSTIHVQPSDPPASGDAPAGGENQPSEAPGDDGLVLSDDACDSDEDCVPAECCHATACVGTANAPSCDDAMCTQDCRYGTLDCGGACLCHEGRCAARLSEPPQIPGVTAPAT